jgi:O-antigen ligase
MSGARAMRFERTVAWPLVCALVLSIPWEKSLWVAGVGTVTRLLGALALLAVMAAAVARRSVRRPNLALALGCAFAAWEAFSYVWSIARPATAGRAATFVQLALMLWLIWECVRTPARQIALVRAYVAGAAVASVLTIGRYARGLETYYRRYAAPGFDPNDLALTVALSIPLALYLSSRDRGAWAWMCRLAAALSISAVLLTASRTALVVSIIGFAYLAWTWRSSGWPPRRWGAGRFIFLICGAVYMAPAASRERLATLPAEAARGTFHSRTQIWKAGLRVFRAHRLAGTGAGTYAEAVRPLIGAPAREGHQYVAHNAYLSVLVETGLVGFSLFALWLGTLAAYVWWLEGRERALWAVVLAAWAVGVTTLSWEFRKPGWLFAGLMMTEWARTCLPPEKRA